MALLAVLALAAAPTATLAATFVFDTPISGDTVAVTLTVADAPGGGVDLGVSIPPGQGDLLGLFGNVADEALLPAMGVESPDGRITQWQLSADQVWKVGGGNTLSPVKTWDWGVRIDQQGSGGGPIETASFRLTGPVDAASLVGSATQGWGFGVRVQGTSGAEGSAKIGMAAGTPPLLEPPAIAIETPTEGTLFASTPVTVSGSVSGTSVVVTVNGLSADVSGGGFSAAVPLEEGANTLTATATNAAGSATDAVSVVLDTLPPVVTIAQPADGAQLTEAVILVSGSVADASPVTALAIDGDALSPGPSFTVTASLLEGPNTITVTATDAAGHQGSASVTVVFAPELPLALTIDTPTAGALVSKDRLPVAGLVSDAAATVRVNGVLASVTGSGYVAEGVPLAEGPNTLTATATRGSASAQATVQVTYNAPPQVRILTPAGGDVLRSEAVDVVGVVDDATALVDVNGVTAGVGSGGRFLAPAVPLATGENLLVARAIDPLGARGSDQVSVTRDDDAAPGLRIVLVEFRRPFTLEGLGENEPEPGVLVYDRLARFQEGLRALGIAPSRFSPPIDRAVVGLDGLLFVFSEEAETLELLRGVGTIAGFGGTDFENVSLFPISDFENGLPFWGLEAFRSEILPEDFEPRFYEVFEFGGGGE